MHANICIHVHTNLADGMCVTRIERTRLVPVWQISDMQFGVGLSESIDECAGNVARVVFAPICYNNHSPVCDVLCEQA